MTKLSQLLAVEKGVKERTQQAITALYHTAQKPAMWSGIIKTYRPKDDEGDQFPPESTLVQQNAEDYFINLRLALTRLYDVVATKDATNGLTGADVMVDGQVILAEVKAPTLLFLEKQLFDLRTAVRSIPTLSLDSHWDYDTTSGVWQTHPVETNKSKKIPRNHVRAEATKEHPAQVDVWTEDVVIGTWTTRALSGGLPRTRQAELLARIDALSDAVKQAREDANGIPVADVEIGKKIFDYLLA